MYNILEINSRNQTKYKCYNDIMIYKNIKWDLFIKL